MMKLFLVFALTCVLYGTSQSAVIKPEIRIIPALALKLDRNVLDGNNDPLSPGGGTSGPDSGNENGSTNNNNGGKKKKKKGNQGDGRGTKKGKTNWT
eukprot:06657.XXX_165860_166613_1 [CDS] Oithona nana genome sequencing.